MRQILFFILISIFMACSNENPLPTYKLTTFISPLEGGELEILPKSISYKEGDVVTLTPLPKENWIFDKWDGDIISEDFPLKITMTSDISITSVFKPRPKTPMELSIEDLAGNSSITWIVSPGGSVVLDNRAITSSFSNFKINISATKTYTTTGGGDVFDSSGSWDFVGSDFSKIVLTGSKAAAGIPISFTRSGRDLILTFTSIAQPAGNYRFILKR